MTHCVGCGYLRQYHAEVTELCPGMKSVKWREPGPIDRTPWREIIRRDVAKRAAEYAARNAPYVPEAVPPPLVPARAPQGPAELAGYQGRQAVGLGRRVMAAGGMVQAYYSMRHDGTEFCAVKLVTTDVPPMRAVATWTRKPGNAGSLSGWSAGVAYCWPEGSMPVRLTHTELEGAFGD